MCGYCAQALLRVPVRLLHSLRGLLLALLESCGVGLILRLSQFIAGFVLGVGRGSGTGLLLTRGLGGVPVLLLLLLLVHCLPPFRLLG